MRFEVSTHLSPEEVIEKAERYFLDDTGLEVSERGDNRLEFTGAIGNTVIKAHRSHGHTVVYAETDRGVGLDITDRTLRFLYTVPHI